MLKIVSPIVQQLLGTSAESILEKYHQKSEVRELLRVCQTVAIDPRRRRRAIPHRCPKGSLGSDVWFRCPVWGCGRRVAVLYGIEISACRQCHQLTYESQRERPYSRALTRAQAIVETLGGTWAEGFPDKPKRMHWRKYSPLFGEYEDAQNRSWPPWLPRYLA